MSFLKPNYDYPGLPTTTGAGGMGACAPVLGSGATTDSGLPGAADNPGNWIDGTITSYDPYPLPSTIVESVPGSSMPATSATEPTGNVVPPASVAPSPASTADLRLPASPPQSVPSVPVFQHAYAFNPAFHGERKKAHDEHVTHEPQPVSFTVPDGCNAMEILFGPVELAPITGQPQDFDHVIQTGKARVVDAVRGRALDEASISPGQQVAVIVPWRAASTARIEAGRLRMLVMARFFASNSSGSPQSA